MNVATGIGFAVAMSMSTAMSAAACSGTESQGPTPDIGAETRGLSGAARRPRSEAIRDVAAGEGMTNGVLLAGIAQVETGLSHCWSEATWACQGPSSPSCDGGPVIAGAADGPCSAQQGGLGLFQFDGGTFDQTIARDGEEILLLEGNISHAVEFVAERVRQDIASVDSIPGAIEWLNAVPVEAGDPMFEEWIALVSCRYNGCCGCASQEGKYRDATIAARDEFEPGFWDMYGEPPACEPIPSSVTILEQDDPCAIAGGDYRYWREVSTAGHGGSLLWTHTTDADSADNFGQWNLEFVEAGVYRLDVATDGGTYAQSTQTGYRVRHNREETVIVLDQSRVDGFQPLGELEFAAGGDQWIRFDDNTGEPLSTETRIAFDALRVTAASDPDDPDDPDIPPIDDGDIPPGDSDGDDRASNSGGCSTSQGDSPAWLPMLAVLGLMLRRRRRLD